MDPAKTVIRIKVTNDGSVIGSALAQIKAYDTLLKDEVNVQDIRHSIEVEVRGKKKTFDIILD